MAVLLPHCSQLNCQALQEGQDFSAKYCYCKMLNYYKNHRPGGQYKNQTMMSNLLLSVCLSLFPNEAHQGLVHEREDCVEHSLLNVPVQLPLGTETEKILEAILPCLFFDMTDEVFFFPLLMLLSKNGKPILKNKSLIHYLCTISMI